MKVKRVRWLLVLAVCLTLIISFYIYYPYLYPYLQLDERSSVHDLHQKGSPTLIANAHTFIPGRLSQDVALDNPQRGPQYYGDEAPPPGVVLADRYKRWCWDDLEPQRGQYNFSLIDRELVTAQQAGYTFGFRIMPSNPDDRPRSACLPAYLKFVSYNSQLYLDAARALFVALGRRYDHDPRLGWLDMSLYGCWGEWNESCGEELMTAAFREQLINIEYQAFPDKRFLMFTDHKDSLEYALDAHRRYQTGIRADCLGDQSIGGAQSALDLWSHLWMKAPIYFEYCDNPDFQQALDDIKTYHASIIGDGDGNIESYSRYNVQKQSLMWQNYRLSGYRFVLNSISFSPKLPVGKAFTIVTSWSNSNVAPVYHPWNVMFQLRNASHMIVWQGKSVLDLQSLLPGRPQPVIDRFTLPDTLRRGIYTFTLQVLDAQNYYKPLELAIAGMQPDRSYTPGSIVVDTT